MKINKSEYTIEDFLLIKSEFNRQAQINYDNVNFREEVTVGSKYHEENGKIFITLRVVYISGIKDNETINPDIKIEVQFVGIFSIIGELEKDQKEYFILSNAPTLMYPVVREHVMNLSLKGNIRKIILPPVYID